MKRLRVRNEETEKGKEKLRAIRITSDFRQAIESVGWRAIHKGRREQKIRVFRQCESVMSLGVWGKKVDNVLPDGVELFRFNKSG